MLIDPFSIALEIAFGQAAEYPFQAVSRNFKNKKFRKRVIAQVAHLAGFSEQQSKTLSYVTDDSGFARVFLKGDFAAVGSIVDRHGLLLGDIAAERLGEAFRDAYRKIVVDEADQAQALLLQDSADIRQNTTEIKDVVRGLSSADSIVMAPEFPQFVEVPARDPFFVGRSDELSQLEESLAASGVETVVTQVAAGMGGVGKTSLVVEFCHLHRDEFEVVRWLVADDRQSLVERFLAAAPALGVSIEGLDVSDAVARVRSWFEQTERDWLLVFDNADDPHVLEGLVPNTGVGSVVATSRQQDWNSQGIEPLPLGVLDRASAIDLLEKRLGRSGDVDVGFLVDYLGCLALAVSQAAAYCSEQNWSFGRYLQMLQDLPDRLFAANKADLQAVDGSDKVMLTVWDASVEQAIQRAGNARDVLNVLSFYAADDIPRELVVSEYVTESLGTDVLDIEEALGSLIRFSLINENAAGFLSVHRLTQEVARVSLDEKSFASCLDRAIGSLSFVHPFELESPESWQKAARYGSHILSVVEHSERNDFGGLDICILLNRYATSIKNQGEPLRAVPLFERARDLSVSGQGAWHPATLLSWASLAGSYRSVGRIDEAIEIGKRVASESKELLGAGHSITLNWYGDLALGYQLAGCFGEAIEIWERVTPQREKLSGAGHPDTLTSWGNLASNYRSAGRIDEAIEIEKRVASLSKELLGAGHPDTLTSWGNLASSYQLAGCFGEAIEIWERVTPQREKLLGAGHPDTLAAWANLASIYLSVGHFGEAIEILERVAPQCEELLSAGHPDTLAAWGNLASSYQLAGRFGEAIEILERVAPQCEKLLGAGHPATLTSWGTLAGSYRSAGWIDEATTINQRVASQCEKVLGAEHPTTLAAWVDLAGSYRSAGRAGESEKIIDTKLRWLLSSKPEELDPLQGKLRSQLLEDNAD